MGNFRTNSIRFAVAFLVALFVSGCGTAVYTVKAPQSKSYVISGVDYDEAYSKAVRAANSIGIQTFTTDKSAGTFYGSRGLGYSEMTEFNFLLEKNSKGPAGSLTVTLSIKSSNADAVTREFIGEYGKYVKITP